MYVNVGIRCIKGNLLVSERQTKERRKHTINTDEALFHTPSRKCQERQMCLEIHILTCVHHWCHHPALSGTSRHFFFSVGEQKRSDLQKLAEEENNKQHFTPHHLFPSFLSSCLPQAHLHSSPHLFFPLLLPGNRQEEHHLETSKPQEELAGRRRITQMFHGGTGVYVNTPFSALEVAMRSGKVNEKAWAAGQNGWKIYQNMSFIGVHTGTYDWRNSAFPSWNKERNLFEIMYK